MTKIRKSALFFLEGKNVPASRFRVEQYERALKQEGIKYKFLYTVPDKYLNSIFVRGCPAFLRSPILAFSLLLVIFQRLFQILCFSKSYDVIFLQRDLLYRVNYPFLELFLFWLIGPNKRVVFDVDDAIFLDKQGKHSEALDKKLRTITSRVDLVIAGNKYLSEYFKKWSETIVVPTVVDVARYSKAASRDGVMIIGWTGIGANLKYVKALEDVFQKLATKHTFKLVLVCEKEALSPFKEPAFQIEMREWSAREEANLLSDFTVGIMPLSDNEWSKGKCGLKILQYMALGIPVVATDLGANSEIIKNGQTGLLVKDLSGFEEALEKIFLDSHLRNTLGEAGRKLVDEQYSVEMISASWVSNIFAGL